jgi:AraC-like DNA-binding protein
VKIVDSVTVTKYHRLILDLSASGHPTIQRAARVLGIPVRTLQRRLNDAGLTYSELADEVRFKAACRLLEGPHTRVADIAASLGFADPSNFSRAFLRWSGVSPREYRRRRAGKRPKRLKSQC